MARQMEVLKEGWRITERRGGAIYRTEYTGEDRWVPVNTPTTNGDELLVNVSTARVVAGVKTMRMGESK